MHLAGDAAAQLRRWCEFADRHQRQRLERRIGDDALARRLIASASDNPRTGTTLHVREVSAHGPSVALRSIHHGITAQRTSERNFQPGAAERCDLEGPQLHREVSCAHAASEPDSAARNDMAAAGALVVELKVGINAHGTWRAAHNEMTVERAGARELERRRKRVNDGCAQVRDGEVGTANQQLCLPAGGLYASDRRVAGKRCLPILHARIVDRIFGRVAVQPHSIAQRPTTRRGQLWVEPPQVGEGHRRAHKIERETGTAEPDFAVAADIRARQHHARTAPPE